MASRRNKSEPEYDSDDMSAGVRLMRYYVSNKARSDTLSRPSSSTAGTEWQQSANISGEQGTATSSRVSRGTGKAVPIAESATKTGSKSNKENKDHDNDDNDDSDDTIFRGDLVNFKGDVLFDIVGRHSHQDILEKVAKFHPEATFGQKQLTWRIANAIVARSNRHGVAKLKVRVELDAMRIANGVEFPKNYRPKSRGQQDTTPFTGVSRRFVVWPIVKVKSTKRRIEAITGSAGACLQMPHSFTPRWLFSRHHEIHQPITINNEQHPTRNTLTRPIWRTTQHPAMPQSSVAGPHSAILLS
jgi:hypothetical protein